MATQLSLSLVSTSSDNYFSTFKKLYYQLYTNGKSSRAERISEDLSKILLCKLAEDSGRTNAISIYLNGNQKADEILLPMLVEEFPTSVVESDRFSIGEPSIRSSFEILKQIDLAHAPAHIIGDAFQALIGPRLRGEKGQFFTPRTVVKAMVEVLTPNLGSKVVDPACGTGGFLVEVFNHWATNFSKEEIFESGSKLFGVDKDNDLARLAGAALEIVFPRKSAVFNANSLDFELFFNSMYGSQITAADVVLTNPPFGTKIGVKDPVILKQFALGYQWIYSTSANRWEKTRNLKSSQDPQLLFLELCIKLLKDEGKLGIILPEGVFGNKKTGYVWDFLRSHGRIIGLIDCPRTTFQPSTDIKTNILFFQKTSNHALEKSNKPIVPIAVAINCGHDRRGRTKLSDGTAFPDDFITIADQFGVSDSKYWKDCQITNPYYWVPRFYDASLSYELEKEAERTGGQLILLQNLIDDGNITIRKGHEVGAQAYGTGGIPFIRTSDVSNWEVSIDPTKSISHDIYKEFAPKQNLRVGDILMVVDGRYRIGRTAILHEHNVQSVVQSHLRIISTSDKAPISAYELLYILNMPIMLKQMRSLTFIQSTLGSLGKRIGNLKLIIPERNKRWTSRIDNFRNLIEQRAHTLNELQSFVSPEVEL